jgi:23S rRNA pseudouridine2605 synthase
MARAGSDRPILGVQQAAPAIETLIPSTICGVIMNSRRQNHRSPAGKAKVSLARALSKLGYCSRSKALGLIREGRVRLNGAVVRDSETRLDMNLDRLDVDGRNLAAAEKTYIMLNKPRGVVVTASDEKNRETVYSCLAGGNFPWLGPVGRLDKASEGLLLLTNDNRWAAAILDPQQHLEKTYHVQIGRIADESLLRKIQEGISGEGGSLLAAKSAAVLRRGAKNSWLEITLDEGRNRHLRRLMGAFGIEVLRIVRVAIGPLRLGNLRKGAYRHLTLREVESLKPQK